MFIRAKKAEQRKQNIPNDIANDISDDTDTWKRNSWLYPVITEDQFQAYSKKTLKGDISIIKPAHQQMLASYLHVASQRSSK